MKLKNESIIFAPMEGITDPFYRRTILKLYPEWSYLFTSFLRVPANAKFKDSQIINHFGKSIFASNFKEKNILQILTAPNANTEETVKQIESLGFKWLDLNLGCPSKMVVKHGGGSALLKDINALKTIIQNIRKNFTGLFSIKMRSGFNDENDFEEFIKLFENEGVDVITVHPRTRSQMFEGRSNWNLIKKAVEISKIPIVGNGDIDSLENLKLLHEKTKCHSVMIGREAVGRPWLLNNQNNNLKNYIFTLIEEMKIDNMDEETILKKIKAVSHYAIKDERVKKNVLRSRTLNEIESIINLR